MPKISGKDLRLYLNSPFRGETRTRYADIAAQLNENKAMREALGIARATIVRLDPDQSSTRGTLDVIDKYLESDDQ